VGSRRGSASSLPRGVKGGEAKFEGRKALLCLCADELSPIGAREDNEDVRRRLRMSVCM
jgi:hypothetical protein